MALNRVLNIEAARTRLNELRIASHVERRYARRTQTMYEYPTNTGCFIGQSISWQRVHDLADEASALCAFIADTRGRRHFTPDVSRAVLIRVLLGALHRFNFDFETEITIQVGDVSNDELVAMIIDTTAERYTKLVAAA